MPAPRVSDEELALDVQAYYDHEGNRSEAARSRGLRRQTYNDRLRIAQQRMGIRLGKVADGRVEAYGPTARRLPKKGPSPLLPPHVHPEQHPTAPGLPERPGV